MQLDISEDSRTVPCSHPTFFHLDYHNFLPDRLEQFPRGLWAVTQAVWPWGTRTRPLIPAAAQYQHRDDSRASGPDGTNYNYVNRSHKINIHNNRRESKPYQEDICLHYVFFGQSLLHKSEQNGLVLMTLRTNMLKSLLVFRKTFPEPPYMFYRTLTIVRGSLIGSLG